MASETVRMPIPAVTCFSKFLAYCMYNGCNFLFYSDIITYSKGRLVLTMKLVHNALVCYFNNVWLMFLVF
jgi:hypothetical protein